MAVLLKWKKPSSESNYNSVYIYRSDTELGVYAEVGNQPICDASYYDMAGSGESWYRIRFYDSTSATYSDYSDAMQGGDFYAYCSLNDIRVATNITSNQVNDTDLAQIMKFSCTQLNNDINILVNDEKVLELDVERDNTINGTNVTFYTVNRFIGDKNNDFIVNTDDVVAYTLNADGTRLNYAISSIDANLGKIVLGIAPPSGEQLYFTYVYAMRRVDVVDSMIRDAAILCTAMWCYRKLNTGKATRFKMGSLTVFRDMNSPKDFRLLYYEAITNINAGVIANIAETDLII